MTKHTAGHWEVNESNHCVFSILGGVYQSICRVSAPTKYADDGTSEANAKLIAAAPELLEALKLAQTIIGFGKEWDQIDAAIAKAEGQNVRGGPALYTTIHSGAHLMTDQQLLELAAKAAGIEVYWCDSNSCFWLADESDSFVPLDHDGDALRLAVKLRISILLAETHPHNPECGYATVLNSGPIWSYTTDHNKDPYAATRRAIVRAAANIGKSMGEQA